jgi:AMIN domain
VVWPVCLVAAAPQTGAKPAATIRKVAILGKGNNAEVEITASQPLNPETQVVTGPDRLVIDFANAVPGSGLRNVGVDGSEITAVRVGLFRASPPVTRVVVDLKSPQPYQLFPAGNTIIVKLSAGPKTIPASSQPPAAIVGTVEGGTISESAALPPPKPAPRFAVEFRDGNLRIWADKATLAEVLFEVHKCTGADIPIPAGAEQEQVAVKLGPAPARDVLASLLNGSRFNFIMVGSDTDPMQLRAVLLSVRGGPMPQAGNYSPPPPKPFSPVNAGAVGQVQVPPPDPDPDTLPPDINRDEEDPLSPGDTPKQQ